MQVIEQAQECVARAREIQNKFSRVPTAVRDVAARKARPGISTPQCELLLL